MQLTSFHLLNFIYVYCHFDYMRILTQMLCLNHLLNPVMDSCSELTKRISAGPPPAVTAAKPKLALSVVVGCGSTRRSALRY